MQERNRKTAEEDSVSLRWSNCSFIRRNIKREGYECLKYLCISCCRFSSLTSRQTSLVVHCYLWTATKGENTDGVAAKYNPIVLHQFQMLRRRTCNWVWRLQKFYVFVDNPFEFVSARKNSEACRYCKFLIESHRRSPR